VCSPHCHLQLLTVPHMLFALADMQNEEETASVARVLEFYISNYGALSRRVYWTPSGDSSLGGHLRSQTIIRCCRHYILQKALAAALPACA
jgi:hypothetical protein